MPKFGYVPKSRLRTPEGDLAGTWQKIKDMDVTGTIGYQGRNDWVVRAVDYANAAINPENKDFFGKWIKLAAKRFLKDLERTKADEPPFIFNEGEVERVCEFISCLPHVEGRWETKNITLVDFQVFFLANVFGFRKADGTRRFTSVLFGVARKNAKSTLAAAIGIYQLVMEDEEGPQVISAATTGDQARIVYEVAKRMVDRRIDIQSIFNIEAYTQSIRCFPNGGIMKPINAKASTQDGLNPSCVILDELHAHPDHDLLNVLESAAGARRNPLFLFTTTEGYETPGPWPETRKFAQQILQGVIEQDHFFAVLYAIDDKDNEFDEKKWVKANPLLPGNDILLSVIKKAAGEAQAMPGKHAEFLIKRVNRQSATSQGWINLLKWKMCEGPIPFEELKQYPCYGGLDLASTRDLTSFRLVWLKDKVIYTHGWRWVPATTVKMRAQRNLVPYTAWVKSGHIIETDGEVTDYDAVFAKVVEAHEQFKIVKIAYDMWNASHIASKLGDEGFEMHQFIQGPKSYHPPMKFFEESYMAGNFRHGGDPVLTWCAANIVPRTDQNMNMAPDKKKSADKIDDMTALLMAVGIAMGQDEDGDLDSFLSDPLTLK